MSAYEFDGVVQHRDSSGTLTSLYFNTDGNQPTPATGRYRKRLSQPLSIAQHLWGEARTRGPRQVEHGGIELANGDGRLDSLYSLSFDDCPYTLSARGEMAAATFLGRLGQPEFSPESVSFPVRDLAYTLARPLLTSRYAGTNSGGLGIEGTASDLKGRIKPAVVGIVKNWAPLCVNDSQRIYQVSVWQLQSGWSLTPYVRRVTVTAGISRVIGDFTSGATSATISSIDTATNVVTFTAAHGISTGTAVNARVTGGSLPTISTGSLLSTTQYYLRSVSSTTATLHPTQTDANNNTNAIDFTGTGSGTMTIAANRTAEGCYDWCNDATSGAFIRLGTEPDGMVTVDVTNPVTTLNVAVPIPATGNAVSALCRYLMVQGGFPVGGGFAIASSLTAAGEAATCGMVIDDNRTTLDAVNEIASCVCAGWYFSTSINSVNMRQLSDPSAASSNGTIVQRQVVSIQRVTSGDDDAGVPAKRVVVEYARVYQVMDPADVASSVTLADRNYVGKEYRQATADTTVGTLTTQWPGAAEIVVRTNLATETAAQALADQLRDLYQVRRDLFAITVAAHVAAGWNAGRVITVTHQRYGLSAGVKMLILGLKHDYAAGTTTIWGWR